MPTVPVSSSGGGYPLSLTGATAATRYVGGTTTGAPVSGTFAVGDFVVAEDGGIEVCTVAGSPGTWVAVSGGSDGWVDASSYSPTYASATTFTIAGQDVTAVFSKGTRIKLTQTTVKYFAVVSSSFSTNTTVTVTGGTDYTLANAAITSPYYSYADNPQGFPGLFAYTPTWSSSGTQPVLGNGSVVGSFAIVGKHCFANISFTAGTTSTFGTGQFRFAIPVTSVSQPVGIAYANNGSFWIGMGFADAGQTVAFLASHAAGAAAGLWSNGTPFAWASTNTLTATLGYDF